MNNQPNNPLHGVTLQTIVTELVEHYGWQRLSMKVNINCFKSDPSIKSSLKFLRKTDWAREKVERLYIKMKDKQEFDNEPSPWANFKKKETN
ncbi:MAG: DUF2132 domain-containing protein [Gammaproteobacteria bacterium]|nr:DUF2132 domain-containing protein [Gammaproteobacteria bacterium]